jgi:hypothetical protein
MDTTLMQSNSVAVVLAWHTAVNQKDINALWALSDPNIEIVGPRGSAYGHGVLSEWLAKAGLSLDPYRCFAKGHVVVVAAHAVWRDVESGETLSTADIASHFRVEENVVRYYARFDTLAAALDAADLSENDEIPLSDAVA